MRHPLMLKGFEVELYTGRPDGTLPQPDLFLLVSKSRLFLLIQRLQNTRPLKLFHRDKSMPLPLALASTTERAWTEQPLCRK